MPCTKAANQVMVTNNSIVISFIGIDNSGKSTIVKVLKSDKNLNDTSPTVGYEPHQMRYLNQNLTLFDLGGGIRVRDIWRHYLAESYGFVFVVDASDRNRLNESKLTFHSFIENEKVVGKPILILANKQDSPSAFDESDIVHTLNIEELANRFEVPCRVETCVALKGVGKQMDESIKVGFDWLVKMILQRQADMKQRIEEDVQRQKAEEARIRSEKSARLGTNRSRYDNDYDNDEDDDPANRKSPWKTLKEMSLNGNSKQTSLPKLSAAEKQLIDEMDQPKSRLTTISEENKKKPFRNNKLAPYDLSDSELNKPKTSSTSWATVDYGSGLNKRPGLGKLEPLQKPARSKYDYDY